jgi:hypothetical protein
VCVCVSVCVCVCVCVCVSVCVRLFTFQELTFCRCNAIRNTEAGTPVNILFLLNSLSFRQMVEHHMSAKEPA